MEKQMTPQNVVIDQQVQEEKIVLARQMRREMTAAEAILWLRLRRNGLGVNFRRQQIIDGFIADFYCHSAALVVEVDGPIHESEYDAERDCIFSERGIKVLRFQNQDVYKRVGFVLAQIRRHLSERKPLPARSYAFGITSYLPPSPPSGSASAERRGEEVVVEESSGTLHLPVSGGSARSDGVGF